LDSRLSTSYNILSLILIHIINYPNFIIDYWVVFSSYSSTVFTGWSWFKSMICYC